MSGNRWSVPIGGLVVGAALATSTVAADEPKRAPTKRLPNPPVTELKDLQARIQFNVVF